MKHDPPWDISDRVSQYKQFLETWLDKLSQHFREPQKMKRDLRFEQTYPYPVERVWEAITDSAAMSDWLMPNDFVPRIGHKFRFQTKPARGFDGIVHCEVIALDPPRRLAFTWKGGGIDTVVTFTLEPVPHRDEACPG
jgi:uncharacterized protein YndB with AHSA1/START domain